MPGGNSPRTFGDGIILPALILVRNSAYNNATFPLYQEHKLVDALAREKGNDDGLQTVNEVLAPHPDAECVTMSPIICQDGTAMSQQHTDIHSSYWEARNRHVLTSNVSQLPLPSHADARWLALRDMLLAARKKIRRTAERHACRSSSTRALQALRPYGSASW